jgi:hypothetical protein
MFFRCVTLGELTPASGPADAGAAAASETAAAQKAEMAPLRSTARDDGGSPSRARR